MKYKHEKLIKKNYLKHIVTGHLYSDEEMDLCYRLASIVANYVNKQERLKLIKPIKVRQKIRIGGKLRDFYSSVIPEFNLYLSFGSTSNYFKIIWLKNEA